MPVGYSTLVDFLAPPDAGDPANLNAAGRVVAPWLWLGSAWCAAETESAGEVVEHGRARPTLRVKLRLLRPSFALDSNCRATFRTGPYVGRTAAVVSLAPVDPPPGEFRSREFAAAVEFEGAK